jgi:hypothetical protein
LQRAHAASASHDAKAEHGQSLWALVGHRTAPRHIGISLQVRKLVFFATLDDERGTRRCKVVGCARVSSARHGARPASDGVPVSGQLSICDDNQAFPADCDFARAGTLDPLTDFTRLGTCASVTGANTAEGCLGAH